MPSEPFQMPGSKACVGCGGLTFRNRDDQLCPRCAYEAELLIEQIELDCLEHDLALITEFEAYCCKRDLARARQLAFGKPLFEHARTQRPALEFAPWLRSA